MGNSGGDAMMEYIVVYVTAPAEEEAERIARDLVENKLAACVNIVKNMRSIYRWQGKIEDETEVLMIVKTRREHFAHLRDMVKQLHSYSVPEIIALPVVEGSEEYLAWLEEETNNQQVR
jgi:periplasmic divalent cation tolerance protein